MYSHVVTGPQNGRNLLTVLAEVNNANANTLCFYNHVLQTVLLNAKNLNVKEMAQLLVVAKKSFPLLSQRERTRWSLSICKIEISDATRRNLGALNHTVPREKIIEHILSSISIARLTELIHESDNAPDVSQPTNKQDNKNDSLFFIDTGAPKQLAPEPSDSDEEDSDSSSNEEMEMFE